MFKLNKKIEWMAFLLLGLIIGCALSSPMFYKKTDDDTYEPGEIYFWEINLRTSPMATDTTQFNYINGNMDEP